MLSIVFMFLWFIDVFDVLFAVCNLCLLVFYFCVSIYGCVLVCLYKKNGVVVFVLFVVFLVSLCCCSSWLVYMFVCFVSLN